MSHYNTIFHQLFNFIPEHRFEKMVNELKMNHYCKGFTAWKQALTVLYAQITGKMYVFITNNFKLSAAAIAEIYHQRRQIEMFFKWIKQNLKIKSFFGTSENAVMTQIYLAMVHYLVLSYIRFMSRTEFP